MAFLRLQGRQLLQRLHCSLASGASLRESRKPLSGLSTEAFIGFVPRGFCSHGSFLSEHLGGTQNSRLTGLGAQLAAAFGSHRSLMWAPDGIHRVQQPISDALASPGTFAAVGDSVLQQRFPIDVLEPGMQPGLVEVSITNGTPESSDKHPSGVLECVKREYQPSVIIRKRRHGYLARIRSKGGQRVLQRRRAKGRWKQSA